LLNPDEWTWDFQTNYLAEAPQPDFKLVGAVRGTTISINVDGPKGKYGLYRSWEPAYIREKLGEFDAGGGSAPMIQDMAAADSYSSGRFRAIYEVTRLVDGRESLPRRISVCGLKNGKGVSALADGRLVVATNAGIANPFAVIFDGTTPAEEFFYHYRFGHTARKVVQSQANPKRFYAILTGSDTRPSYGFDIAEPDPNRGGYDVRNELNDFWCSSVVGSTAQTLTLSDPKRAALLNPGDSIYVGDESVRITAKKGLELSVDGRAFPEGAKELRFNAARTAGVSGSRAEWRELRTPGGLACFAQGRNEYVAIADTGNRRIVVWTDATAYVAKFELDGFEPLSIASDPVHRGTFWAVGRTESGNAVLWGFAFDGTAIKLTQQFALSDLSASKDGAAALAIVRGSGDALVVAISDTTGKKVFEYSVRDTTLKLESTLTEAIGVCAGDRKLEEPIDVAYVSRDGVLQLFALDASNRLVRLR
jgi:hypothetical protein